MTERLVVRALIDVGIFAVTAAACFGAQTIDRPITAVLVFLTGVIAIAVHSGLRNALIAAVAASVTYNFMSGQQFEFGMTSSDEFVPLIAFNVCAIITGVIVGRLKDAALRAHHAQSETAFLLSVSDRLQQTLTLDQIEKATRDILPPQIASGVEVHLAKDGGYFRPATGEEVHDRIEPLLDKGRIDGGEPRSIFFELEGRDGELGIVKFRVPEIAEVTSGANHANLRSVSALLALAIERCLLLEKLAEAQASKRNEELKDTLLSSVSHDLRTPVTAIEAAASALTSSQVSLAPKDRDALLRSIVEQCRRLDHYTSELLDVGKIQAGIETSQFESVELAEIVQLAVNQAKPSFPDAEVERNFPNGPVFVTANALMLEQAIHNIVENALKFGGQHGPIAVAITTEDDRATIQISDQGPGIAEADRPHLFTRFYRSERTRNRAGTGLGLYIAKGFIEAFDGTVEVNAKPGGGKGRGATFSITLPVVRKSPDLKVVA